MREGWKEIRHVLEEKLKYKWLVLVIEVNKTRVISQSCELGEYSNESEQVLQAIEQRGS